MADNLRVSVPEAVVERPHSEVSPISSAGPAPARSEQEPASSFMPSNETVNEKSTAGASLAPTYFSSRQQVLVLLREGFLRWLVTAVLVSAAAGTMYGFSSIYDPLSEGKKKWYNAIMTGISVALSLNIATSFKDMTLSMRWKFLAIRPHTVQEADLILGSDSLLRILRLMWVSRRKARSVLMCSFWLLLNIGLQVTVALLGLTYNIDTPTGYDVAGRAGNVFLPDLRHFYPNISSQTAPPAGSEEFTAHAYGESGTNFYAGTAADFAYPVQPIYLKAARRLTAFDFVDHWVYQFYEQDDQQYQYFYTNRTANVTWDCASFNVIDGGDGRSANITYQNAGVNVTFNAEEVAPAATTYVTDTTENCGPRCGRIWVFQAADPSTGSNAASLSVCNTTVSQVANVWLPQHELPDAQAQLAARAIALQGFRNPGSSKQWNRYPQGFLWAMHFDAQHPNDQGSVGSMIGDFATGTLAAMNQYNPTVNATDAIPLDGTILVVTWKNAIPVLAILAGVQLICFIVVALWCSNVVVKEDSHVSIARLLRPLVEDIGSTGGAASSKQISQALDRQVVYGYRPVGLDQKTSEELHELDLATDLGLLGQRDHYKEFPSGLYR